MCQSIYFSLPLEKRWGGGRGNRWCHSFHRTSQRYRVSRWLPGIACVSLHSTYRTELAKGTGFSSFSHRSAWAGAFAPWESCRQPWNLGRVCGKVFLTFLLEVNCGWANSGWAVSVEDRCWPDTSQSTGNKGKMIFSKATQSAGNSCICGNSCLHFSGAEIRLSNPDSGSHSRWEMLSGQT